MSHKRFYGSSVLDPKGNFWVLGGTANSQNADSTEIYEYKPKERGFGRWRKGFPLPAELRDTGIQSQCSVRISSTHVFMAGGFAQPYRVCDPLKNLPTIREDDSDLEISGVRSSGQDNDLPACDLDHPLAGGTVLKKAWMYDGNQWDLLPSMSTPRDRPACSLVESGDGASVSYSIYLSHCPAEQKNLFQT